jgi:hypothetical protein
MFQPLDHDISLQFLQATNLSTSNYKLSSYTSETRLKIHSVCILLLKVERMA